MSIVLDNRARLHLRNGKRVTNAIGRLCQAVDAIRCTKTLPYNCNEGWFWKGYGDTGRGAAWLVEGVTYLGGCRWFKQVLCSKRKRNITDGTRHATQWVPAVPQRTEVLVDNTVARYALRFPGMEGFFEESTVKLVGCSRPGSRSSLS